DALLAIDLVQAKIIETDRGLRRAKIRLPLPRVVSPRVDHERTKTWSVQKTSWVPWKGDPDGMRDEAMRQAQKVIAGAAGSQENIALAKQSSEKLIASVYGAIEWAVQFEWADNSP